MKQNTKDWIHYGMAVAVLPFALHHITAPATAGAVFFQKVKMKTPCRFGGP
jgi:hypothetical protein